MHPSTAGDTDSPVNISIAGGPVAALIAHRLVAASALYPGCLATRIWPASEAGWIAARCNLPGGSCNL